MFGHDFYHETLRKYVILFGTLFNDIHVKRKDSNGNTIQKIKLPLSYAPQEKMLQRLAQDPNLNRQVAITLPRASFEMTGMQYAPDRKMNTLNRLIMHQNKGFLNFKLHKGKKGDEVNLEFDIIGKYVERVLRSRP